MNRLIILPENAGSNSGFSIVVKDDIERLNVDRGDTVIVYCNKHKEYAPFDPQFIAKPGKFDPVRIWNLLQRKRLVELTPRKLAAALPKRKSYESIFCGDVTLYRAVKGLFPDQPITVRFHNYWTMIRTRCGLLNYRLGWLLRYRLYASTRIEMEALADPCVHPIFITDREQQFFRLLNSNRPSDCWSVDLKTTPYRFVLPSKRNVIWFGGTSPHTRCGIVHFVRHTFPELKKRMPDVQFHLFGRGTQKFDNPDAQVFGHGYFQGNGMPMAGEGLFINPDLMGGGIKVKVSNMINSSSPFITTHFGAEGYELPDSPHVIAAQIEQWPSIIAEYLSQVAV